jgi:hypothetical protein
MSIIDKNVSISISVKTILMPQFGDERHKTLS